MGFDFGGFAGGLSSGFNSGVSMAKTLRDVIKERKLQDLRENGIAEAEAARSKGVQDLVKEGIVPSQQPTSGPVTTDTPTVDTPAAATATPVAPPGPVVTAPIPPMPLQPPGVGASADGNAGEAEATKALAPSVSTLAPASTVQATPTQAQAAQPIPAPAAIPQTIAAAGVTAKPNGKFSVNGQSFETREQAQAAAEKATPDVLHYYRNGPMKALATEYVRQGDFEKANALTKWGESENGREYMKTWHETMLAAQSGDSTKMAKGVVSMFNRMDNGQKLDGNPEEVKDKAGNVTGFNVRIKTEATGETRTQFIDQAALVNMGLSGTAPDKAFEMMYKTQQEAAKIKYEASLKAQERSAKREDDLYMEGFKHKGKLEFEDFQQGNRVALENSKQGGRASLEDRKSRNNIDETAFKLQLERDLGPEGANRYMKSRDPAEAARMLSKEFSDPSHPDNREFKKLDQAGRDKFIQNRLESFLKIGKAIEDSKVNAKPGENTDPNTAPNPGAAPAPMKFDPKLPIKYQKGTGKPFHLVNGQYVPIDGDVPKASAPAALPPTGAGAGRGVVGTGLPSRP